jgi:hypothetical protein
MRSPRRRVGDVCVAAGLAAFFLATTARAHGMNAQETDRRKAIAGKLAATSDATATARHVAAFGPSPLSFEPNLGQFADRSVEFVSRGKGYTLALTSTEAVMALTRPFSRRGPLATTDRIGNRAQPAPMAQPPLSIVHMKLVGANAASAVGGLDAQPGKINYIIGKDPEKWRTNVPTYAKVRYQNVYPDIDMVYYGNQRQLEYDFVVAPGADPGRIKLAFIQDSRAGPRAIAQETAGGWLTLDAAGDLSVRTFGGGLVTFRKPLIYQNTARSGRTLVDGGYVLTASGGVGFDVPRYDRSRPLVIDPTLVFSTYLGGSSDESNTGDGITVDSAGNVYLVGSTYSTDLPTTAGVVQPSFGGAISPCLEPSWGAIGHDVCGDAFVAKLSPTGAPIYITYLGGTSSDSASAVTADSSGRAYIAGSTSSPDFPTTPSAFQSAYGGNDRSYFYDLYFGDAFIAELTADGSGLVYSSYLGGISEETARGVALDGTGKVLLSGAISKGAGFPNFPATAGAYQTTFGGGNSDAFLAKFDTSQSGAASLVYSTYLGGPGDDGDGAGWSVTGDASGNAYMVGSTNPALGSFPTTPGAFQTTSASTRAVGFIAKFNPTGSVLLWSTLLGGTGGDYLAHPYLDASGNVYVGGGTSSTDFPTTAGSFQPTYPSVNLRADGSPFSVGFVARLDPHGSSLLYSTYLPFADISSGFAVNAAGNVFFLGISNRSDFPTVNPLQGTYADDPSSPLQGFACYGAGNGDLIIGELNPSGSALVFSTYLGGTAGDCTPGGLIAIDSADNIYVAGFTLSTDFPVTSGAFQPQNAGGLDPARPYDAFIARISPADNTTGTAPIQLTENVSLTFSGGVTAPGTTAVTQTHAGPAPPAQFTVGDPPLYYDISTTATFTAPVTVCVSYKGTSFPEGIPRLVHYSSSSSCTNPAAPAPCWDDITTSVDTPGQRICGSTDSFSPFAVLGAAVVPHGLAMPLAALAPVGSPVPMPSKAFKQGRTLPLRLQLLAGGTLLTGVSIAAPQIVGIVRNGGVLDMDTMDLDSGNANDNGTFFRWSGSDWVFNLSTKALGAGTYTLTINVPHGGLYTAGFVLK